MQHLKQILLTASIIALLTACGPNRNALPLPVEITPNNPIQIPPIEPLPPIGEIDIDGMQRGNVYLSSSELFIMESFPVQIMLNLIGELPTPCHQFRYYIFPTNQINEIHLEIFSVYEEGVDCIQVMQPFNENISVPIDGAADGIYTIWIFGELIGEFSYPG